MKTEQQWLTAFNHLKEVRQQYTDIGIAGIPALTAFINPLLFRYEKGERTDELYKDLMSLA